MWAAVTDRELAPKLLQKGLDPSKASPTRRYVMEHACASTRSFSGPGQVPRMCPGALTLLKSRSPPPGPQPAALALPCHGPVSESLSTPLSSSTVPLGPSLQSGKTRRCQVSEKLTNCTEPPRAASTTRHCLAGTPTTATRRPAVLAPPGAPTSFPAFAKAATLQCVTGSQGAPAVSVVRGCRRRPHAPFGHRCRDRGPAAGPE